MVLLRVVPVQAHPLRVIPADDRVYADLYRLATDGLAPVWAMSLRPLTRLEAAQMVARALDRLFADRTPFAAADLAMLEHLVLEFADELALLGYRVVDPPRGPSALAITGWGVQIGRAIVSRLASGTPPWFEPAAGSAFRLEVSASVGLGPVMAVGIDLAQPLLPDPAAPRADRLYLTLRAHNGVVQAGLDEHRWGPATGGAFLLSDNAGALETVRWSQAWERLRLTKLLAPLSYADGRYLYGTRLDWLATDAVRIGVAETVVASGGVYLPYALSPFPLIAHGLGLWVRRPEGYTDNYNVAVDFDWRVGIGTVLYGELFVDELETADSALPSRGGATAGLYIAHPFSDSRTDLRLEHARTTNWTYSTTDDMNEYVRAGKALGHWCAPDCELWSAELLRRMSADAIFRIGYDVARRGEGQLGQTWSSPAEAWTNLYLSGVVETTQAWRLSAVWSGPAGRQELGVGWSTAANASHVAGQTREDWWAWWEARFEF